MSKRRGNFLLLGALIGFIAGLFFAPKKGSELRRDAKNKIDEIKENPKDVLQGTFDDVKDRSYKPLAEFHTQQELWQYIKENNLVEELVA